MRHLVLIIVMIASALAGALMAKLHTKWTMTCGNVPCAYLQRRLEAIQQMIASRSKAPAYLVIGDSLTEIAHWRTMCGHDPVAVGVGGARSDTWLPYAKSIADMLKPESVILALGTNDVLTQGRLGPYERLVSSLYGHRLVAVSVHEMPIAPKQTVLEANTRIAKAVASATERIVAATTDGVHLTTEDYQRWFAAIEKVACGSS
jgi:hypothetical protein